MFEKIKDFFFVKEENTSKESSKEQKEGTAEVSSEEQAGSGDANMPEVFQMDETFQGGVGMVVSGTNKELMKTIVSSYKQHCDSYRKHITVSSLNEYPFAVTSNGPHANILMFFVPFSRENDVLLKIKEYGMDFFESTALDGKGDQRCFFATYDKKAAGRIINELGIEPEYVYVTFYDSGIAEDKERSKGFGIFNDFGRRVILDCWLNNKFREFAMDESGKSMDLITDRVPTLDQILSSNVEKNREDITKQRVKELKEWGVSMQEIVGKDETQIEQMYESIIAMREDGMNKFIAEFSGKIEESFGIGGND